MRPIVGVTARPLPLGRVSGWPDAAAALQASYLECIRRADGQDVLLAPRVLTGDDARSLLAGLDALILSGGDDVDPSSYGETPHPSVGTTDRVCDEFEIALVRAAIQVRLPVLAICRGLQILNVALGGTLDQHITGRPGLLDHGIPGPDGEPLLHEVVIDDGSLLARSMRTRTATCSSHHHQAIDQLAPTLRVTSRSSDGVIEGVELTGHDNVLAVQWHPEETAGVDPVQQRLFDALADRARVAATTAG